MSGNTAQRIFFGVACPILGGVIVVIYRRERSLAECHVIANGEVTRLRKKRRGHDIVYQFRASDGKKVRGESTWSRWYGRVQVGTEVLVLYDPNNPDRNQPAKAFLFYAFTKS
jgi:hypothetical protein